MAFNQGLSPFSWTPTAQSQQGGGAGTIPGTMIQAGAVNAGDWCVVFVSYRNTNTNPVEYRPGYFMYHVIYTPNSDDTVFQADQMTTFGGSASNRRRHYRLDPGPAFQVPFNGQLSIIAGGDSATDGSCIVDVILGRGFAPRDAIAQAAAIDDINRRALEGDESALYQLTTMNPASLPRPQNIWAPPIIGTPQLVAATWLNVPPNTQFPWPDGAQKIEIVNDTGVAGSPTRLPIANFAGHPAGTFALNCASGIPRAIGPLGQGFGATSGVQPTWASTVALTSVTIWSVLGG